MVDFHGNPKHLKLVKKGTKILNEWRKNNPSERLYLEGADLGGADLSGADLSDANLGHADLSRTDLSCADLSRADLSDAVLRDADLNRADLYGADLYGADLSDADLGHAVLGGADLTGADLGGAVLSRAVLGNAVLSRADLTGADLTGAIFTNASFGSTCFVDTNLTGTKGLETCIHYAPSAVDVHILRTAMELPREFLQGIGLPDVMIDYLPDFFEDAIHYYSLFISYSTKNEEFAGRLYRDLQNYGVRCWYSPEHIQGGEWLDKQIEKAIHLHDRVLVILSEESMKSE